MKFEYFGGEQRSPEWYRLRLGRVTASRLSDWLAVSKAKNTPGKPLKARLDYEKELLFERKFDVSFDNYVSEQMEDGINLEDYALQQYAKITGNTVRSVGAWYNEYFVASPDGAVTEKGADTEEGIAEVKVVRDNTFTEVLSEGVPDKWQKQIQGELLASGKKWCDFIALNLNTKKIVIVRILPDSDEQDFIKLSIVEELVTGELYDPKTTNIHSFIDPPPFSKQALVAPVDGAVESKSNLTIPEELDF